MRKYIDVEDLIEYIEDNIDEPTNDFERGLSSGLEWVVDVIESFNYKTSDELTDAEGVLNILLCEEPDSRYGDNYWQWSHDVDVVRRFIEENG